MFSLLPRLLQEAPLVLENVAEEGSDFVHRLNEFVQDHWVAAGVGLAALFGMLLAASWASKIVGTVCFKARVEETLARFFSKLARWAVLLVGSLLILDTLGVDTASFSVLLGAMGLAVGLALQGTLGNFASGVMLLIFRPFKVGDVIKAAGVVGKVFEVELFTTVLDTPDNRRIIVPNGAIFGGTIENISYHKKRRIEIAVGTDYGADLDQVRAILNQAAASVPERLQEEGHQVALNGLGDSCIDWRVRVWCLAADYWACMESTNRAVKMALDEAGVGIPFPQMDVHFDKLEASHS